MLNQVLSDTGKDRNLSESLCRLTGSDILPALSGAGEYNGSKLSLYQSSVLSQPDIAQVIYSHLHEVIRGRYILFVCFVGFFLHVESEVVAL
jgi:hypothetical protein